MALDHRERQQWVAEIATINERLSQAGKEESEPWQ
jgi:hypothetical protein